MADRALTAGMATEVQAAVVRPVLFYEGEFATGFLRLFTGVGSFSWDSKTWTGGGHLLSFSAIPEGTQVEAQGFNVTLTGMPSASISLALQSMRQGKPGKIWLGFLNASGAIIADPYLAGEGKLDISVIEDDGETCTITVQYESRLIELLKPCDRRYTHEDQQLDFPGDLGFVMVPALQDMLLIWGGPAAGASPVASPITEAQGNALLGSIL